MLNIKIDSSDLLEYTKRLTDAQRVTSPALALSLNNVGDGLVAVLTTNLSKQSGLVVDQVRGLMKVRRATRNNLAYDISFKAELGSEAQGRKFEGRRESKDFGRREPGQLVVVVTKKDDLVCMDCEELGAAGPMPIEVAMEHVPKHPNCRCVIMPYVSGKRLPLTMTSVSGSDQVRRSGEKRAALDQTLTLRQLAQDILDRTAREVRIQLG